MGVLGAFGKRARNVLRERTRALLRDESGQATVEYMLLLTAVTFGAVQISQAGLKAIDGGIAVLGATLEKDLKTGRADVGIWDN